MVLIEAVLSHGARSPVSGVRHTAPASPSHQPASLAQRPLMLHAETPWCLHSDQSLRLRSQTWLLLQSTLVPHSDRAWPPRGDPPRWLQPPASPPRVRPSPRYSQ